MAFIPCKIGGGGSASISPMFGILSSGVSSVYATRVFSSDDSLMTDGQYVTTASGSYTVKRAAKGKIYFGLVSRGTTGTAGTFTIKGTTYTVQSMLGTSIDVNFVANDAISFTVPTAAYFGTISLVFVEEA